MYFVECLVVFWPEIKKCQKEGPKKNYLASKKPNHCRVNKGSFFLPSPSLDTQFKNKNI